MKIDVITLFPKMFDSPFAESMIKRALGKKIIEVNYHDLRKWAWNSYGAVDDRPFGGDVGMLLRADVIGKALDGIIGDCQTSSRNNPKQKVILTSARGKKFTQSKAEEWSKLERLVFICGHYEGVDQRVADYMVDEEISIGDYVLTGGELPTMVMIDAITRLLPGVLGKDESSRIESFSEQSFGKIEFPQYTRPRKFKRLTVPKVLLSGDPKKIKEWQLEQSRAGNDNSQKNK